MGFDESDSVSNKKTVSGKIQPKTRICSLNDCFDIKSSKVVADDVTM